MQSFAVDRRSAIVAAVLLLTASTSRAQNPSAGDVAWREVQAPAEALAAARIERELDAVGDVDFHNATLEAFVEWLRGHRLPVQIDRRSLEDAEVPRDHRFSFQQKGISVRSALNAILRDCDLAWLIADEMLLITSPEEAENRLVIRAYDVRGIAQRVSPTSAVGVSMQDYDLDSLINVIASTVAPDTWDSGTGPAPIYPLFLRGDVPVLVLSQTYDVQQQIGLFLQTLQSIAATGSIESSPVWHGSSRLPRSNLPRADRDAPSTGGAYPPAVAHGGGILSDDTGRVVRQKPKVRPAIEIRDYE